MLILIYAACAFAVSPDIFLNMVRYYVGQAVVLPVLLSVGLPLAAVLIRPRAPVQQLLEMLQTGTARLLIVTSLFCIGMAGFTTFKLAIPHFVPFYADPFLADLDLWLHGANPGDLVHAIIPDWAQYPIGSLYGPVWFVLWFGLLALVCLQPSAELRRRYFWSMALTICLLGTIAATAMSSVGPIFYAEFVDPLRFAALMQSIEASAIGDYMAQASGYLLTNYHDGAGRAGTGISAMPSMHLAIVTLNAWMLTRFDRLWGLFGWIYVGLIQLGSVYLGWHYAVDGYFSIAVVSLIWWLVGRVMAPARDMTPNPSAA